MSRRVGLSRASKAEPLLKRIEGRQKPAKQPADDDAPPLSTDESASEQEEDSIFDELSTRPNDLVLGSSKRTKTATLPELEPSSDEDQRRKISIKRTTFKTTRDSSDKRSGRTDTKDRDPELKAKHNSAKTEKKSERPKRLRLPSEEAPTPYKGTSRPPRTTTALGTFKKTGGHLKDEHGFVKVKQSKATYGKKGSSSQEAQACMETLLSTNDMLIY